jgi:hypothetical protein
VNLDADKREPASADGHGSLRVLLIACACECDIIDALGRVELSDYVLPMYEFWVRLISQLRLVLADPYMKASAAPHRRD